MKPTGDQHHNHDQVRAAREKSSAADLFGVDPLWNTPPRHVKVSAPGKINAYFRVGPLRADGYHSVASTYLAVSRHEEVLATVKPDRPASDVSVSISPASTLDSAALASIPLDGSNLVVKAALLVADLAENPSGVHLEITKHVPLAGGMGGGSAGKNLPSWGPSWALTYRSHSWGAPPSDWGWGRGSPKPWHRRPCTGFWCQPATACPRQLCTKSWTIYALPTALSPTIRRRLRLES